VIKGPGELLPRSVAVAFSVAPDLYCLQPRLPAQGGEEIGIAGADRASALQDIGGVGRVERSREISPQIIIYVLADPAEYSPGLLLLVFRRLYEIGGQAFYRLLRRGRRCQGMSVDLIIIVALTIAVTLDGFTTQGSKRLRLIALSICRGIKEERMKIEERNITFKIAILRRIIAVSIA